MFGIILELLILGDQAFDNHGSTLMKRIQGQGLSYQGHTIRSKPLLIFYSALYTVEYTRPIQDVVIGAVRAAFQEARRIVDDFVQAGDEGGNAAAVAIRNFEEGAEEAVEEAARIVDDFVEAAERAGGMADEAVRGFEQRANKAMEDFARGIQRLFFFGRKKRVCIICFNKYVYNYFVRIIRLY